MPGRFPTSIGFESGGLTSEQPSVQSRANSGRLLRRIIGGHFWSFTAKFPRLTDAEFRPIKAFMMKQEGSYGTFGIWPTCNTYNGNLTQGVAMPLNGQEAGAWLSETVSGTRSGADVMDTGDFSSDPGWVISNGSFSISGGDCTFDTGNIVTTAFYLNNGVTITAGKAYLISLDITTIASSGSGIRPSNSSGFTAGYGVGNANTIGTHKWLIESAADSQNIVLNCDSGCPDMVIDNLTVTEVIDNKSELNNPLTINGSLTAAAVATGSGLMGFSGWGTSNFLSQAHDSAFDYGTGDHFWAVYFNASSGGGYIVDRNDPGGSGPRTFIYVGTTYFQIGAGGQTVIYTYGTDGNDLRDGNWHHAMLKVESSVLYLYIDGKLIGSSSGVTTVTNGTATLHVGTRYDEASALYGTIKIALLTTGGFAPTDAEVNRMFAIQAAAFNENESYSNCFPKVNGASQTGDIVLCDGYPASELVHAAGDFISFGLDEKLYMVTDDIYSDSSGNAEVRIKPNLFYTPKNNSSVSYYKVPMTAVFANKEQKYDVSPPLRYTYTVDVVEALS